MDNSKPIGMKTPDSNDEIEDVFDILIILI
jgi:hypothetical protein